MRKLFHSTQRAQSMVEFALILPVLLLLAVVVFDLGRVVYYSSTLHNAAREAARYGIVYPNDIDGMEQAAENYAIGLDLDEDNFDPPPQVIIPEGTSAYPPPHVTVTIVYDFYPATPLVSQLIPNGHILLRGEATMKLEVLP